MDMSSLAFWKDVAQIIGPIATAAIAAVGLRIAHAGLKKWQLEEPGKRKLAVAEEALRLIYAAEQSLREIRAPFVSASEMVVHRDGKTIEIGPYEAMINRYIEKTEVFRNFENHRAIYGVYFGRDAMTQFDDFSSLVGELMFNIDDLRRSDDRSGTPEERARLVELRKKIRRPFSGQEAGEFDRRLDAAIEKLRIQFEGVVAAARRDRREPAQARTVRT